MTLLFNAGTVTATNGSAAITFANAGLLPMHCQYGDEIAIGGVYSGFIESVDHQAQTATITPPFAGTSGSGKTYAIRRATPISVSASEVLERTFKLLNEISVFDSEGIGLLYSFNTATAIANPGAQKVAFNNVNPQSVTRLLLSTTDGKGKDVAGILAMFQAGYAMVFRAVETGSFAAYRITGAPTVANGFADIPVQYVDHDGVFTSSEPIVGGFAIGVDTALVSSWGIPSTHVASSYMRRNAANTAMEYRTPAETLADIGGQAALSTVSQTDAEAGTSTTGRIWTAQRVGQAIDAMSFTGHESLKTAAYTVVKADHGKTIVMNSATAVTLSLTAVATLGQFTFAVKNIGAGTVTIDPNGAETIDGLTTFTLITNEGAIFEGNGTVFRTIAQSRVDGSDLTGLTKTQVGLGNVDNTSDANKPVSTAQAASIATKEPLRTTVTQAVAEAGTDANVYAWTSQRVRQAAAAAIAAWVGTAPTSLDTLDELAAALADDANFASTMTTLIGTKLNASAVSSFIMTLLDDADAATARTTLGAEPARTTATQAEAEAGTSTTVRAFTPERLAQAIRAIPSNQWGGGSEVVVTANTTLGTAHNGKIVASTSAVAITLTLPTPATVGAGWLTVISAVGNGDVTVAGTFDSGATSITLEKGGSMVVTSNGSTYRPLLRGGGAGGGGGTVIPLRETLVGTGSATYTLANSPASEDAMIVWVGGVVQNKGAFSFNGNDLTLDAVVPVGTNVDVFLLKGGATQVGVNPLARRQVGNGGTTYTLLQAPFSNEALDIFVDGILQPKDGTAYTVSGTTITFSAALPVGSTFDENHLNILGIGVPSNETVGAAQIKTSDVAAIATKILPARLADQGNLFSDFNAIPQAAGWYKSIQGPTNNPPTGSPGTSFWVVEQTVHNTDQLVQEAQLVGQTSTAAPWRRTRSGATWGTWEASFTQKNIVGTVTQSSAVVTGAIIERGGNANGQYTKFADGTMVCWHSMTQSIATNVVIGNQWYGLGTTWTFPATFFAAPIAFTGSARSAAHLVPLVALDTSEGVGGVGFALLNNVSAAATNFLIRVQAMGRWY
jgi:hypothetical protein